MGICSGGGLLGRLSMRGSGEGRGQAGGPAWEGERRGHGELVIDGVKPRRVCACRIRMWGQAPTLEEEWPRHTAL